ncbi:MAG: hypothetical protein ACRCYX_14630, partial [Dermatophilaceae bacterium]
ALQTERSWRGVARCSPPDNLASESARRTALRETAHTMAPPHDLVVTTVLGGDALSGFRAAGLLARLRAVAQGGWERNAHHAEVEPARLGVTAGHRGHVEHPGPGDLDGRGPDGRRPSLDNVGEQRGRGFGVYRREPEPGHERDRPRPELREEPCGKGEPLRRAHEGLGTAPAA